MCVKRNIVGRSRYQCCSKKATMHSVSVAELRVIVDRIKYWVLHNNAFMAICYRLQQWNVGRS